MSKHKYSSILLIFLLFMLIGVYVISAIASEDIDEICDTDGNLLYRSSGEWDCLDSFLKFSTNNILYLGNDFDFNTAELTHVGTIRPYGDGNSSLGSTGNGWNNIVIDTYENSSGQQFLFDSICTSNNGNCANNSVVGGSANFTNVAYLNNTQTFTGINTFANNVTISQGSGLFMTPRINIGNLTSNNVNGTRALGIGGRSTTRNLQVTGTDAVGFGNGVNVTGNQAVVIGVNAKSNQTSTIVIGATAEGGALRCIAIGTTTTCTGSDSLAMGRQASSTGAQSFALGTQAVAGNTNSFAIGGGVFGQASEVYSTNSFGIGTNSKVGYYTDGFDIITYPTTTNNIVVGVSSTIANASNSIILGATNIIYDGALGFIIGRNNVLSSNISGGIIGTGLTNSLNNSILMSTGVFTLVGSQNTTINFNLGGNLTGKGTYNSLTGMLNVTSIEGIQSQNYSSADGTLGFTGTCTILGLTSIQVKNGLVVGCT